MNSLTNILRDKYPNSPGYRLAGKGPFDAWFSPSGKRSRYPRPESISDLRQGRHSVPGPAPLLTVISGTTEYRPSSQKGILSN